MINLHFSIVNPWYKENFKNIHCRSGLITEHKAWEFQIIKYSYNVATFSFQWTVRTDHAGLELEIGLFGYSASLKIYDTRHWNYTQNTWEKYDNINC